MCGIWGHVAHPSDAGFLPRATAQACVDSLRHRGPDGQALLWQPPVAVGHTRLAIVDPSPAAAQPMRSPDGRYVLSFNGEILNHEPLRRELAGHGYRFAGTGDTEVLLAAYLHWGPACLHRLRGMFAVAVVDVATAEVWLARDRLGIKPLYYLEQPSAITFCSEPKGLLPLLDGGPRLDLEAVSAYLSLRYVPAPRTLFGQVRQLEPGTALTWRRGRGELCRWWSPQPARPGRTRRRRAAELRRLVADAVAEGAGGRDAQTAGPPACYLSGGIDSAVLAVELGGIGRPVRLLTAAYPEPGFSEAEHARRSAARAGLAVETVPVDAAVPVAELLRLTALKDHPVALHNEPALARLAVAVRDGGSRVALSGEGADELFSGYGRLARLPFEHRRRMPRRIGRRPVRSWRRHVPDPELRLLLERYSYLPLDDKLRLLKPDVRAALDDDRQLLETLGRGWRRTGSMHHRLRMFLLTVHLPGLLQALDSAGMACGVETRFPYLDHRLVSWAVALPARATLRWRGPGQALAALRERPEVYSERRDVTKLVLRDAFAAALSPATLHRPKMPFPAPLAATLSGPAGAELRRLVLGPDARLGELFDQQALRRWWEAGAAAGTDAFGRQAWLLVALEAWLRVFLPTGPLLEPAVDVPLPEPALAEPALPEPALPEPALAEPALAEPLAEPVLAESSREAG